MKFFLTALLCITMVLGLAACGSPIANNSPTLPSSVNQSSNSEPSLDSSTPSPETSGTQPSTVGGKTLVVYFSMPETTKADNLTAEEENSVVVIDGEVLGNTQYLAT